MVRFLGVTSFAIALSSLVCPPATAQAPAQKFTLQQVMSAPFNSDLIAAPVDGGFAWLSNVEGRRNIWVAVPSSSGGFTARQITPYSGDDGQEITGPQWTPGAKSIALARASDLFQAGVDMSGVHDWNVDNPQNFAISDTAADPNARWRLAFESSPLASVKRWRSPVLLTQGDDGREVPFLQTVQLAAALRRQNVPMKELIFPDEVHDFLLHRDWVAAYMAAAAFFDNYLKSASARTAPAQ